MSDDIIDVEEYIKFGAVLIHESAMPCPELYEHIRAGVEARMRLSEHTKPMFDPLTRIREGKPLIVNFSASEWAKIESGLSRYISGTEIKDLIMQVFTGDYKIVKR